MLVGALVGAVLSLITLAAIVFLLLKRSPLLFVADGLPDVLYNSGDESDRDDEL